MNKLSSRYAILLAAGLVVAAPFCVMADDAAPAKWSDTLTFGAQIDVGYTASSASIRNGLFGRLFDNESEHPLLNQVALTAARPLDATATEYDFGFKLQGMYGSDARFTRFTHQFVGPSRVAVNENAQNQFDLVEANVQAHVPWLSEGGADFKLGQYATPIGAETIDPSTNYFYSHSYVFNYGIPMKHSGLLTTWHATPVVDLYLGGDTGINTNFERFGHAQNKGPLAFLGGVGLNLLDGKLTVLGLTHVGTETPQAAITNGLLSSINTSSSYRETNDLVTTWKVNDKLTLVNELNWIHDDGLNNGSGVDGYGIVGYALYALNEATTLNMRAEIFDDAHNAFVAQYVGNGAFMRVAQGQPTSAVITGTLGKGTTYGGLTLGVNYKPETNVPHLSGLTLRPELRFDQALRGGAWIDNGNERGQVTFGFDALMAF